jgi:hypothetical protein
MMGGRTLPLPEGGGHEHPSCAPMERGFAYNVGHAYRLGW